MECICGETEAFHMLPGIALLFRIKMDQPRAVDAYETTKRHFLEKTRSDCDLRTSESLIKNIEVDRDGSARQPFRTFQMIRCFH